MTTSHDSQSDRFRGCLLGLAVGDAVGAAVEFQPRGTFQPLTDMIGGGPFDLLPGQWTDDTSMALCLAASLLECRGFDAKDQMDRYVRWYEQGYMSSTGECFDIGNTVRSALMRYQAKGDPFAGSTDPNASGNGSIMRLAPVPMFYADEEATVSMSAESSRTTHASPECLDACRYFGLALHRALAGAAKEEIVADASPGLLTAPAIGAIAAGAYKSQSVDEVKGTGYVVASLEAALWSFWTTTSYVEAVLQAANLGDDADTTAAIAGQLAGAHYGESNVPAHWLEKLTQREEITTLADRLLEAR